MIDPQSIAAIVFIAALTIIILLERKRIQVQKIIFPLLYFVMFKTKLGLKTMDSWAKKYKRPLSILATIGIVIGYLGMILIALLLIKNIYDIFTRPETVAGVALVLPFKARGAVFVPFFYWILSIFILAVIHEFSHGVIARLYNVKVKSSGFAALCIIFPILPAAFVEPDEKQVKKIPRKQQLAIFAAGPFSNILAAAVIIILFLTAIPPLMDAVMLNDGVKVVSIVENDDLPTPAQLSGLENNEIIKSINNNEILTVQDFKDALDNKQPKDPITVATNSSTYDIILAQHPKNESRAFFGLSVVQNQKKNPEFIAKYGSPLTEVILWVLGLLYWLYVLNLGIGLFNLVPLGPIDGGRMLLTGLESFMSEAKAKLIWAKISWIFLFLIIINIAFAFIK